MQVDTNIQQSMRNSDNNKLRSIVRKLTEAYILFPQQLLVALYIPFPLHTNKFSLTELFIFYGFGKEWLHTHAQTSLICRRIMYCPISYFLEIQILFPKKILEEMSLMYGYGKQSSQGKMLIVIPMKNSMVNKWSWQGNKTEIVYSILKRVIVSIGLEKGRCN